jgi:hypothetical protein
MSEIEKNNTPDDATEWYSSLRDRNIRQVDASLNEIASASSNLEHQWNELGTAEETAHDELNTREIVRIQAEKQRLMQEAQQLQQGYSALQNERQRLETHADPAFDELIANSSAPSQMFLRTFRHKLEGDANALKRLMHADARCKAVGIKPDSRNYFSALETAMGFSADDRNLDDLKGEFDESTNTYRQERKQPKVQATEAQKIMARNLPGISEDEYLKACSQPFSQASQTVQLEPDALDFGQNNANAALLGEGSKGMEVNFDEAPKKAPARYKAPDPKTSVNLSPAELALIENMAVQTNTPLAEARKAFAQQKLALHSGKTSHMLYEDRLKAMGQR